MSSATRSSFSSGFIIFLIVAPSPSRYPKNSHHGLRRKRGLSLSLGQTPGFRQSERDSPLLRLPPRLSVPSGEHPMKRAFLSLLRRPILHAFAVPAFTFLILAAAQTPAQDKEKLYLTPLNIEPRPIAKDATVKYDYDIVYVRAPRPEG